MKYIIFTYKRMKTMLFSLLANFSPNNQTACRPICNGFTWLGRRCVLGKNCNFNGMRISGFGHLSIGHNFHSGENCLVITSNHNYEGSALPYDNTTIDRDVTIGDHVWIGSRVIILPGAMLGDGCIIQAGSVVAGRIPPLAIAGGLRVKYSLIAIKNTMMNHFQQENLSKRLYS